MRLSFWHACVLVILVILSGKLNGQENAMSTPLPDSCWADSVLFSLTLEEKIGQLIFARANKDNIMLTEIPGLIRKYNIGGVVFFKGSPALQVETTNNWQKIAKTPLFVSIDAERGLAMRLDSTYGFPYMMTLGACSDDSLVYEVATEIARGCKRMGIHINYGPVVDINSNPRNPVINSRSFGENKVKVARKSLMYVNGLRNNNILHTAKHFPGHGDTDTDSHYTLPVVNHSRPVIFDTDISPYTNLIKYGLEGVMVAHVFVPSLDSSRNAAASLSKPIITDILKKDLGFTGLVFTDALEMRGVTNYFQPGDIEVKAFLAGNDILLMPQDVEKAILKIKQAVDSCWIWPEDIDERCLRVLKYKQKYIPRPLIPINTSNLIKDLNPVENDILYRRIMTSAFTLVKNNNDIIPLDRTDTLRLASLCIGSQEITAFQHTLGLYADIRHFCLPANASMGLIDSVLAELSKFNLTLVGIVNTSIYSDRNFGLSPSGAQLLSCLQEQNKMILTFFGNPYAIGKLGPFPAAEAILVAYQDNPETYRLAAQSLFGALPIQGHLPVSVTADYPEGHGFRAVYNGRLQYILPEECGINRDSLNKIDSLIQFGIDIGAYPGCQVLAAWKGKVFYYKAFGRQSWQDTVKASTTDIYDLASVTKIAATTLAIMKLLEEGKINLDEKLGTYLHEARKTNKGQLIIRDILTHQARLKPWIPFYTKVLKNGYPDSTVMKKNPDSIFSVKVADSLFMNINYIDSIRKYIYYSPLEKKQEYKYSDLGFYLLKDLIEHITREPLNEYVNRNFYSPLGLATLTYNPLDKFGLQRIIPTENDTLFRHQLIRGQVHDPGAAMLGGVAGHAGLFSNANDMAIILQMLVNGGVYGEHRYFKTETVKEFTTVQFPEFNNRRGLGFDKPMLQYIENGPSCKSSTPGSFGHSGFTGTYVWGDPEKELTYVFLCNRINPDASNHKLSDLNIRTRVHEMFYQLIKNTD
ncbi:MAG: glycoside hydrolase family 3 N-terminal domain-containing protein [Bacteroidales bacterium]